MSTSMVLILIVIGIITGIMAGMLGIGGAIIMIPALVFLLGISQQTAQGTSLAVMLPPIGIIAAYNYYKAGHVDIKFAIILSSGFTTTLSVLVKVKRLFTTTVFLILNLL